MDVIVITGAPGVGKTVLLPILSETIPGPAAWLDGDAVGRTRPIERTRERLNLIQDNIRACARNFAAWGAEHFITGFVLPSSERMERLAGILREDGHRVGVVALIADNDVLAERHKRDWAEAQDYLDDAVRCNAAIAALADVPIVDTTHMAIGQVAIAVIERTRAEHGLS